MDNKTVTVVVLHPNGVRSKKGKLVKKGNSVELAKETAEKLATKKIVKIIKEIEDGSK